MGALIKSSELEHYSSQSIIAVRFNLNKQANFHFVLNLCEKAELYQSDKTYLACFNNSHAQLKILASVLSEVRDWRQVTIYANGRPQLNKYAVMNVLSCYLTAASLSDHKHHCHIVIDSPFVNEPSKREVKSYLEIDIFGNEFRNPKKLLGKWKLPCKMLHGKLDYFKSDEPQAKARLESSAIENNCNLCPYFKADEFMVHKTP